MLKIWDLRKILPELEKRATNYINERAKTGEPFFLYFPLTAPHTPIAPAEQYQGKSQAGAYGDFVFQVDAVVGSVMKALDQNDLAENTLVIFTSDNGSPARDGTNMSGATRSVQKFGHNPSYVFRGVKSDIWEGGHRIPFFARWSGKIKPGSKSDEVICLTDFFATCAEIFNDQLPANTGEDSYNILPVLTGENYEQPIREAIVHHSSNGSFSIRQGKWKLEICAGSGGWTIPPETAILKKLPMIQLYDLKNDIREQNNLSELYPDVVYRLTRLLEKYVSEGRSTPGASQKNDGNPNIWKPVEIRNDKYETSKVEHLAVGKKVVVINKVPLSYTKNGIDVLTDGIRASSWYDDGYWTAVEGENFEVQIDLEKIQHLKKISIGFLEDQDFWIFFPKEIEISLSANGKIFGSLKSISRKISPNKKRRIRDFFVEFDLKKARYIKLKIYNEKICPKWHKGAGGKAWLFMDEVIVE